MVTEYITIRKAVGAQKIPVLGKWESDMDGLLNKMKMVGIMDLMKMAKK